MYQPLKSLRLSVFLPLLSLLVLGACGGSSSSSTTTDPGSPDAGLLKPVSTPDELEASIKAALTTVAPSSGEALGAAAPIQPSDREITCPFAKASAQIITPSVPNGVVTTPKRSPWAYAR